MGDIVINKDFIMHSSIQKTRKRYSLTELLRGITPKIIKILNKNTRWAREGKPVGREKA